MLAVQFEGFRKLFLDLLPKPKWFQNFDVGEPGIDPVLYLIDASNCEGHLYLAVIEGL
jgi:hypothetical protein